VHQDVSSATKESLKCEYLGIMGSCFAGLGRKVDLKMEEEAVARTMES
jgi:hypothetical protein